jgi:ABC-type lipoprotein release transport system permease subunit
MIHHRLKTYFSIRHWVSHARRQSRHVQHIYAFVFAGGITALLGVAILYFDYGFWQEKKEAQLDTVKNVDVSSELSSPGEMLTNFFYEAKEKWDGIKASSKTLLESTETYSKTDDGSQ